MEPQYFKLKIEGRLFSYYGIMYHHKADYKAKPFFKTSNILIDLPRFCIN